MAMAADVPDPDALDPEDVAEMFDETHYSEDDEALVEPDLFDDAYDDTQKLGDADDEEALELDEDEVDAGALDDEEVEDDELGGRPDDFQPEDIDIPGADDPDGGFDEDALGKDEIEGLEIVADADTVEGGEDDFTNFQSRRVSDADLAAMGYDDARQRPERPVAGAGEDRRGRESDKPDPHIENNLDEGLEETFPASDPVSISSGGD
jgi:hypothetical protein